MILKTPIPIFISAIGMVNDQIIIASKPIGQSDHDATIMAPNLSRPYPEVHHLSQKKPAEYLAAKIVVIRIKDFTITADTQFKWTSYKAGAI